MKHPIPSGLRALQSQLRREQGAKTPTPEQRAIIQAAISLRGAKGYYRDQYTAAELDMLVAARVVARDLGQTRVAKFIFVGPRDRRKKMIRILDSDAFHACPRCGAFHADSGVKTFNKAKILMRARVLDNLVGKAKRRHKQQAWLGRILGAARRYDKTRKPKGETT